MIGGGSDPLPRVRIRRLQPQHPELARLHGEDPVCSRPSPSASPSPSSRPSPSASPSPSSRRARRPLPKRRSGCGVGCCGCSVGCVARDEPAEEVHIPAGSALPAAARRAGDRGRTMLRPCAGAALAAAALVGLEGGAGRSERTIPTCLLNTIPTQTPPGDHRPSGERRGGARREGGGRREAGGVGGSPTQR